MRKKSVDRVVIPTSFFLRFEFFPKLFLFSRVLLPGDFLFALRPSTILKKFIQQEAKHVLSSTEGQSHATRMNSIDP